MTETRFQRFFRDLNLFKTSNQDEHHLRIGRWSTRLYIPLLFIVLLILLFYTILETHSEQIQIRNPTLSTYLSLYEKSPDLKCPCTEISISYEKFLELSPLFHQVCSSDLITDEWISFFYDPEKTPLRYPADFRATAFNEFQILRELCSLSITAIDDGIETLYKSELISGELLNEKLFQAQVEADISASQTIIMSDFTRSFSFTRNFIVGNALLTGIQNAYTFILVFDDPDNITIGDPAQMIPPSMYTVHYAEINNPECSCDTNVSCSMPSGFYDFDQYDGGYYHGHFDLNEVSPREFVDGWRVGCWHIESLLSSTLESFYNQTKFNQILRNINSSVSFNRFAALNSSVNSHFFPKDTLDILLEKLFLEDLFWKLNYSSYYSQCQPSFCEYSLNVRSEPLYIITSLLGLYGGLSVVLRLIIPYIIEFILNYLKRHEPLPEEQNNNPNVGVSSFQKIRNLYEKILHLNLYRHQSRMEENDIKHQIWSTRLYLGLVLLSFVILILYSSIIVERRTIVIGNPSLETVQNLESKGFSLTCPCEILSINYEYLFELKANSHKICSSVLVTQEWIQYFSDIANSYNYHFDNKDFYILAPSMFQLLSSMCQLSERTIADAIFQFGKKQLITSELLQLDLFEKQISSIINEFTLTLPQNFLSFLQIIRNLTDINQFMSGSGTNCGIDYQKDNQTSEFSAIILTGALSLVLSNGSSSECVCANDLRCQGNAALLNYDDYGHPIDSYYIIPHFYTRCYLIEGLLSSTMECFYDNNPCFNMINNISDRTIWKNFSLLDPSQPSHFPVDVTMENLVSNLFVDSWTINLTYAIYFQKCHPLSCSYSFNGRRTLLEIITTITALIGGLSTVFKVLSPYFITIFVYLIYQLRNRHLPANNQTTRGENESNWKRLIDLSKNIRSILLKLNVFEDVNNPSRDANKLNVERQSTRLYIVLLVLTTLILVIYTSLTYRTNEITVKISSIQDLIDFQDSHSSMIFSCPCTKLSSVHSKYYQMEATFHPLCSSDFIKQEWLNSLYKIYDNVKQIPNMSSTYSGTSFAYFQAMLIICNIARQYVLDATDSFLRSSIVTSQMPNIYLFHLNTNLTVKDFQSSLSKSFVENVQMFRGLSQGNGFVSVYMTNWRFYFPNLTEGQTYYFKSETYDGCDCGISSSCVSNSTPIVPGYVVGCSPLESYLRSTLECLYSSTCLNQILAGVNLSFIPKNLDENQTRFSKNIITNDIVEELFIESWSTNVSYENFYAECQPISCSYIITQQYNLFYVLTTLLGLYGGITILLKLIIPFLLTLFYKCLNKFYQTNTQIEPFN